MRMLGGEDSQKDLSEFVAKSSKLDPVSCSLVRLYGLMIDDVFV
jgi:hypothetical protein